MRDKVMTFGFAALAAIATAGWMRQPASQMQMQPASLVSNFAPPAEAQAVPLTPAVGAFTEAPAVQTAAPVVRRQAAAATPVYQTVAHRQPRMGTRQARIERDSDYRNSDRYRDGDYRYEQPRRSTGKSAAIIAGGAATGAAIGGMAGGGKGAAVGAVIGGVAGTVYDRSTYKKTDGWGWKRNIE